MIVSHWPVASGPTVELMTLMAEAYRAAPEAGPAAALRTAMRRMREKDIAGHEKRAEPGLFWPVLSTP